MHESLLCSVRSATASFDVHWYKTSFFILACTLFSCSLTWAYVQIHNCMFLNISTNEKCMNLLFRVSNITVLCVNVSYLALFHQLVVKEYTNAWPTLHEGFVCSVSFTVTLQPSVSSFHTIFYVCISARMKNLYIRHSCFAWSLTLDYC